MPGVTADEAEVGQREIEAEGPVSKRQCLHEAVPFLGLEPASSVRVPGSECRRPLQYELADALPGDERLVGAH